MSLYVTICASNGDAGWVGYTVISHLDAGMRLFRFLADFRYFHKFHHFCESSKSGLKFYKGGGGPLTVFNTSSTTWEASTMFFRSTCIFHDVLGGTLSYNVYLLLAVPLTNYRYFSFRCYHSLWCNNSYWHCVSANKVVHHVTDNAGQHASALVKTVLTIVKRSIYPYDLEACCYDLNLKAVSFLK